MLFSRPKDRLPRGLRLRASAHSARSARILPPLSVLAALLPFITISLPLVSGTQIGGRVSHGVRQIDVFIRRSLIQKTIPPFHQRQP